VTPAEAADLLTRCAAFDNRKPSAAAAMAWASALKNVPLDADTYAAVDRYYATPPKDPDQRLWIQPHDIRTHRAALRAGRLEHFVYEPPALETPKEFLENYRRQIEAVASGAVPAPTSAPALTGGPHKSVEDRLAAVGQQVPDGDDEPTPPRFGPLGVHCSACYAPIGLSCKTPHGKRRRPHQARQAAVGTPGIEQPLPPGQAAAEEHRRRQAARIHLAAMGGDQ
jgi:hypothetical protein